MAASPFLRNSVYSIMLLLLAAGTGVSAETLPQQHLYVVLHPAQHGISVTDRIDLPSGAERRYEFTMHRDLHPASPDADVRLVSDMPESWLQRYQVILPAGQNNFTLHYEGEIFHPPQQDAREARAFETSPGIIAAEGVVLTGDSGWYPVFGEVMLSFSLDVEYPAGWHALSQGKRSDDGSDHVHWEEREPQNEIYLIAAPYTEYFRDSGGTEMLVYLREADAALAQRYLDATDRYIAMYSQLIGPYPYAKFALAENFWETGYGMPSFTLLGSQVIRLPFIIDTSYPHEILHNWWGNGVYVDYTHGNWSEGLTAYLADHLLQEQKGKGAEYRRSILQKYADFVSAGRDFPLARFTSRHSEQTEAVGYGKALMLFHMLRRMMGDDAFMHGLRDFYRDYRYHLASYDDLEKAMSRRYGKDLHAYFVQWTQQIGAPQLKLVSARSRHTASGYQLDVIVDQIQDGPAYALDLPVAVTLEGQDPAFETVVPIKDKHAELHILLASRPLRIDIDPEFDVFRRLDRAEIPVAFSQVSGSEKLLIVLPRKAPDALRGQYMNIAQVWQQQEGRKTSIKWDDELQHLPDSGAVWLFGWENAFRGQFTRALDRNSATMTADGMRLEGSDYRRDSNAIALTAHIGQTPTGWLAAPDAAMLPVLARKLPHYSRFSYAAFGGTELTNLAKGMWQVTSSPLATAVLQDDGSSIDVPRAKLAARVSLAK